MSKATWLINGACCALLLWGGFTLSKDWKTFGAEHQVSLIKNLPERAAVKGAPESAAPAVQAWTDILSRNPFSFDRNDVDIAPVAPPAPRAAGPKPVLFGTLDTGSGLKAMLGDQGSRFSSQNVKVGEKFKNWTVVKIEKKSVLLESDGVQETIVMGNAPIDRDGGKTATASSSATVVTTGTSAPAPAPVTPNASAPRPQADSSTPCIPTPFYNCP